MPTYEYECQKCGYRFEEFQSITAAPRKTCPKAECPRGGAKGRVQRLIGAGGGLLFKGSGFYETDYRSDSYKAGEKAAKKDSSEKSSSESSSTDSSSKSSESSSTDSGSKSSDSSPSAD